MAVMCSCISIHAPREGGDAEQTHPAAGPRDFNPRPPRGGRRHEFLRQLLGVLISIHAPREGGDLPLLYPPLLVISISIHAPREGGDHGPLGCRRPEGDFNPRPPRGGRPVCGRSGAVRHDFNPRPPRGGRRDILQRTDIIRTISIHAPREGGDSKIITTDEEVLLFQSTPPARGATWRCWPLRPARPFQSTPPARGATTPRQLGRRRCPDFNPRPPRGGRRLCTTPAAARHRFQSTPPARGATERSATLT